MHFYDTDNPSLELPLPFLPSLSELHIKRATFAYASSSASSWNLRPFPLHSFTVSLRPSTIRILLVEDVLLGSLNATTFSNFNQLEKLILKRCCIEIIQQDTFQAFRTVPLQGMTINRSSNLKSIEIEHDKKLTQFQWEVLSPVSYSLQVRN